jgi:hypothetical protein
VELYAVSDLLALAMRKIWSISHLYPLSLASLKCCSFIDGNKAMEMYEERC